MFARRLTLSGPFGQLLVMGLNVSLRSTDRLAMASDDETRLLQTLIATSSLQAIVVSEDLNVVFATAAASSVLGCPAEQIVGTHLGTLIEGLDRGAWCAHFTRAAEGTVDLFVVLNALDGSQRSVRITLDRIEGAWILRFESSPDPRLETAIVVIDHHGAVVHGNPWAYEWFSSFAVGADIRTFLPEADDVHQLRGQRMFALGSDGARFSVLANASPTRDGRIALFIREPHHRAHNEFRGAALVARDGDTLAATDRYARSQSRAVDWLASEHHERFQDALARLGPGETTTVQLRERVDDRDVGWMVTADCRSEARYIIMHELEEQQVPRSELEWFKTTLSQIRDCVFAFDPQTLRFFYVNEGASRQVGYSRSELLSLTPLDIKPEFTEAKFRDLLTPLLEGQDDSITFEAVHRTKWATRLPVEISLQYVSPRRRKPYFVAIVRDISERKTAEEALRNRNRALRATSRLDRIASRVMLAFIDESSTSRVMASVTETLAQEGGYRPLAIYLYNEWTGELEPTAATSFRLDLHPLKVGQGLVGSAAAQRTPIVLQDPDDSFVLDTGVGQLAPRAVFAYPLVDGERLLGVLVGASVEDLSAREKQWLDQISTQIAMGIRGQRQYEELKLLSEQLADRTRHIDEQNQLLQRASRLKSQFLANMSHELRTPLNAIIGFSEVLKDELLGPLSDKQRDYACEIFASGRHLLALINDVLDLSKIEAGRVELEAEEVELADVLEQTLALVTEQAQRGEVRLGHHFSADLGRVVADPRRIKQVVLNLLSNGIKFTRPGGRVELLARRVDTGVEIVVEDTGIGIAKGDQGGLFEPFHQLDADIDREFEGTGLGLAMVKNLVGLHGGTVEVESEVERGSRFIVRLPPVAPTSRPAPLQKSSVLVVEADPADVQVLRTWLGEAGFAITDVCSASEAWDAIDRHPPDLVLIDVVLAQDEGWTLLSQIRRSHRVPDLPVVLVSLSADRQRGLALGATEIVEKPVSRASFVRVIERLQDSALRTLRILVVDDDPRAVDHVATTLQSLGAEVERAYGGREALLLLSERAIDLVVLDLMMPDVSGFEVLQAIRTNASISETAVVVLTAKDLSRSERDELERHVASVMAKSSWDRERFVAEIRAVARGRAATTVAVDLETRSPAQRRGPRALVVALGQPDTPSVPRLYLRGAGFETHFTARTAEAASFVRAGEAELVVVDLAATSRELESEVAEIVEVAQTKGVGVLMIADGSQAARMRETNFGAVVSRPVRRHAFIEAARRLAVQAAL